MDQKEIDLMYLREAYKLAMNSHDPSTQNGAIIVNFNNRFNMDLGNVVGADWNHFPKGVIASSERLNERDLKYPRIEHAERNAIYSAARKGNKTEGKIMYVPWYACSDCGRAIISAGISEVIGYTGPEKWWVEQVGSLGKDGKEDWTKSIGVAMSMLDEAGVKRRIVEGKIGGVEVLFRGKKMRP
ncbi:hypothetical protein HYX13_04490 [Candidatus Woesearchaeota archaeon]|nr:hypothetical protein [Candidatus Woesearchaeota archaeon]